MKKFKVVLMFIIAISLILNTMVYAETPKTAQEYFELGMEAWAADKSEEAIRNFDQALLLDPKLNDGYIYKASSLYKLKRTEEALACIETAIAQNPQIVNNLSYKGSYLTHLGRYAEAVEAFKISITDEADPYYEVLALAYLQLDDTDNCLKALRNYIIHYSEFKEYLDPLFFAELESNPTFVEIMGESRYKIEDSFDNAERLKDDLFKEISFLEVSEGLSKKEQQEVSLISSKFNKNILVGNIYNQRTASTYGLSPQAPDKEVIISVGRLIKKLNLIGFKGTYTTGSTEVIYTGRINGVMKAAIVREKGKVDYPGVYSKESEDYFVFVKNNGTWEFYTSLHPKAQE